MIERTLAGLAAAAANGRKGGRPRKVDDADAAKARALHEKGVTARDVAKMLGVSRATVYRYLSDSSSPTARSAGAGPARSRRQAAVLNDAQRRVLKFIRSANEGGFSPTPLWRR